MATHENTYPNPSIPEDLIYVILSRLPVKSLLRFKTACRSWLSLISSRDFIRTHLSISTNDSRYAHHHLLLRHWPSSAYDRCDFTTCSVSSLLNEPFTTSMLNESGAQTFKLDHPRDIKYVVGCCNGLICLASNDRRHIFLWNPSTRKSRRLPKLDYAENRIFAHLVHTEYGFCYDESNDDFKVFAIFRKFDEYKYKVAVYSSKYDFWRIVGDFFIEGTQWGSGQFANGAIHWIVRRPNKNSGDLIIVCFDVKTETWREVMHPQFVRGADCWTLFTFGENLMIHTVYAKICSDFWVMKEGNVEECWRKLCTIPHDEDEFITKRTSLHRYPKPICVFVNGDILLNLYSTIGLYNTEHNTFKDLLDFRFNQLQVHTYVESLVSLEL